MDNYELYRDIAERTQGDIYIGVVGPVRTGKSTFIKRFMELNVVPNIANEYVKARVVDELPQSGAGKSIMTTQPRFVPNDAVELELDEVARFRMRMIDCVGYVIPEAIGRLEDDMPRMVRTPWFEYDIPFEEAAEIGTRKVIAEHSTVGILMTTDGTVSSIPRSAYQEAEERVVRELKESGKPFIIVLNTTEPDSEGVGRLSSALEAKYGVSVIALDVLNMSAAAAEGLLEGILMSFPVRTVSIALPGWLRALERGHWIVKTVADALSAGMDKAKHMRDYPNVIEAFGGLDGFEEPRMLAAEPGTGAVTVELQPIESLFYRILGEQCGQEIADDTQLVELLKALVAAKREYDKVASALMDVKRTGYGLVPPNMDEIELEEPQIVHQGSRFGVKLRARASGMHLIKVDVESEISPLVGTEEQSQEFADYLSEAFESDPAKIWETNIFGKPLYDLVCDGMNSKVNSMPESVRLKLQSTLQRMVNDGCNGLICVML